MSTWNISYNLNKSVICTGDNVILNLDIHNLDLTFYLYIDKIHLKGVKNFNYTYQTDVLIPPDTRQNLAVLSVPIPFYIKGNNEMKLYVETSKITYKTTSQGVEVDKFENLGTLIRKGPIKFQISPTPCYRAFVSRSINPSDKPMVEPIVKMVQDWGFETTTVGINSFVEKHREPTDKIVEDIVRADCLVAIATIRDQSAFTGLYSTLQWLHSEVSFAYMAQKPVLLIVDNRIDLGGILGEKKWPVIPFNNNELLKLQFELDDILPYLRLAIAEKRTTQFEAFIQDIQQKALSAGYVAGLQQKRIEESSPQPTSLLDQFKKITK